MLYIYVPMDTRFLYRSEDGRVVVAKELGT